MVTDLTGAWQASASVDTDLSKWATHAATAGCHHGDLKYSSSDASIGDDAPRPTTSRRSSPVLNPLAKPDGLPTCPAAQL